MIVNDDVQLAQEINADGIHVGQDDMEIQQFASQFKNKIIGLSVGNLKEYQQSDLSKVDYIGVGQCIQHHQKMTLVNLLVHL